MVVMVRIASLDCSGARLVMLVREVDRYALGTIVEEDVLSHGYLVAE